MGLPNLNTPSRYTRKQIFCKVAFTSLKLARKKNLGGWKAVRFLSLLLLS